ncbi:hypothetical protein, partial [Lactiplantibacillus pentosus]|uniref:hypothetical protein n=1 Tax=Lactiplantibacillus pentosus TaxID=1589 RepID=UPI00376FC8B8
HKNSVDGYYLSTLNIIDPKNPRWSACFGHFQLGFLVGFQFNHFSGCGGLLSEEKYQRCLAQSLTHGLLTSRSIPPLNFSRRLEMPQQVQAACRLNPQPASSVESASHR